MRPINVGKKHIFIYSRICFCKFQDPRKLRNKFTLFLRSLATFLRALTNMTVFITFRCNSKIIIYISTDLYHRHCNIPLSTFAFPVLIKTGKMQKKWDKKPWQTSWFINTFSSHIPLKMMAFIILIVSYIPHN